MYFKHPSDWLVDAILSIPSKHNLFNEATRIITMTLKISRSEPGEAPFEHRPRLYFAGLSIANDTMISAVHGFVCMTASGYVRWHLVSVACVYDPCYLVHMSLDC